MGQLQHGDTAQSARVPPTKDTVHSSSINRIVAYLQFPPDNRMPRPRWLVLLRLLCLFLLVPPCPVVAYGGNQSTSLRRQQQREQRNSPAATNTHASSSQVDPKTNERDDKVVLLNDLSLEQAYLHHAAEGRLEAAGAGGKGFTASLAQQAARLAAGAYDRYAYLLIHL